jgi:hypothetical protein
VLPYVRLGAISLVAFVPAAGLLVGLNSDARTAWVAVTISLLVLCFSVGWPALTNVPSPNTARAVLIFTGAVSISLAIYRPGGHANVLIAIGLGLPAVFVRELIRPAPREGLIPSVTATTSGVIAVAAFGLWVAAASLEHFLDLATIAGTGITAAGLALALSRFIPSQRWLSELSALACPILAFIAGTGMSFVVAIPWWAGAAVAAISAVAPAGIWLVSSGSGVFNARPHLADAALVTLPLAVAAVPVWAAALMR